VFGVKILTPSAGRQNFESKIYSSGRREDIFLDTQHPLHHEMAQISKGSWPNEKGRNRLNNLVVDIGSLKMLNSEKNGQRAAHKPPAWGTRLGSEVKGS
jgi:hypothetical protein